LQCPNDSGVLGNLEAVADRLQVQLELATGLSGDAIQ